MPNVSIVAIANLALAKFTNSTISSLSEQTPSTLQVNAQYDRVRQEVLQEFPWDFATTQVILAQSASAFATTVLGWNYVYACPQNALKIQKVYDPTDLNNLINNGDAANGISGATPLSGDNNVGHKYRMMTDGNSKYILTNVAGAIADITLDITDPTQFSPLFISALAAKLASEICMPLNGTIQTKQLMDTEFQKTIAQAALVSCAESNDEPSMPNGYLRNRGIGIMSSGYCGPTWPY